MGDSSSTPRFRIRLEDGTELPVSSVEALARRVARGDVGPNTQLYDGGTGKWLGAAKAPVVQFILDELKREGGEAPPGWETEGAADPLDLELTPAGPSEEGESDESQAAYAPPPVDRGDPPGWGEWADDGEDGPESPHEREPPPETPPRAAPGRGRSSPSGSERSAPVPERSQREKDWITPPSEGGFFTPAAREDRRDPEEAAYERPSSAQRSDSGRRRSHRIERGIANRPAAWIGASLIGVALLVGAMFIIGDRQASDAGQGGGLAESAPGPPAAATSPGSPPLSVPDGLEDAADRAATLVVRRYGAAADSVRVSHGLDPAPPEPWLTGFYLANADQFPEIRIYWEAYGRFVADLQALDRAVFAGVLDEDLTSSVVSPQRRPDLQAYLEGRYTQTLAARREAYAQLAAVAVSAIGLHDFLVEAGPTIRHTPAIGTSSVPRDPVLEVGTEDPAVRRELDGRLDDLFDALDRSRGGGPPSQSGLQDDLFGGFGAY